jgi:hypothetical protein
VGAPAESNHGVREQAADDHKDGAADGEHQIGKILDSQGRRCQRLEYIAYGVDRLTANGTRQH